MINIKLKDTQDDFSVSKRFFGNNFNQSLVHQVIVAYAANARQGTRAQKNRAKVTGSNKKPWRQKGTGRARSGSTKSPIWRSGGVAFAAQPKNYSQKINKKMYRGTLRSIFSELLRQDRLIVIEKFSIEKPKTKLLIDKLKDISIKNVLIIVDQLNKNLILAARNLHNVEVCNVTKISPINLISFDKTLITVNAIKEIERILT